MKAGQNRRYVWGITQTLMAGLNTSSSVHFSTEKLTYTHTACHNIGVRQMRPHGRRFFTGALAPLKKECKMEFTTCTHSACIVFKTYLGKTSSLFRICLSTCTLWVFSLWFFTVFNKESVVYWHSKDKSNKEYISVLYTFKDNCWFCLMVV